MTNADALLQKATLTRSEVELVLAEKKRGWALEWQQAQAPALAVTPEMLRRFVAAYVEQHTEWAGAPPAPAVVQRLLATVFGDGLRADPELRAIYDAPVAEAPAATGAVVLVVDDDPLMLKLIRQVLEREKLTVVTAESGGEALLKFQRQHFDLILLDYEMPRMNGPETCTKLKEKMAEAEGKARKVPVVFLTGKTAKENVVEAVQAGGDGYIAKPFTPPDLVAKVRNYLPVRQ